MAHDLKYGQVTVEKDHNLNDSDEPCFVLRAQDITSIQVLKAYKTWAFTYKAPQEHIDSIKEVIEAFTQWQDNNNQLIKIPD